MLLIAPLFSDALTGGLQLATIALARELERRGWDLCVVTARGLPAAALRHGVVRTVLRAPDLSVPAAVDVVVAGLARFSPVATVQRLRRLAPLLGRARSIIGDVSHNLATVEGLLAPPSAADLVVLVDHPPMPGLTALVVDRHPRAIVLSLVRLAAELRARHWPPAAFLARLLLRRAGHPYLLRPVSPRRLAHAVFPSAAWRARAVAAGLAPDAAHTIYFGSDVPAVAPSPVRSSPSLLFVGRLAPDKGLHRILPGLAVLRARRPDVTLTVVAGHGPAWYRRYCDRLVRRLGLGSAVRWHPPISREALPEVCRAHGALLFYSPNDEPVALMLVDAAAAGLPVVSSRPASPGVLVTDGATCVCYEPDDPGSLAAAAQRVLDDEALRAHLVRQAHDVALRCGSVQAMGEQWDRLLCTVLDEVG